MNERIVRELVKMARQLVGGIGIGKTFENGKFRAHRYRPSLEVTDLENAGRRGKRVERISIYDLDMVRGAEAILEVMKLDQDIVKARTFDQAKKLVMDAHAKFQELEDYNVKVDERQLRGVDVTPGDFHKIEINGKHVYIEADYNTFVIQDKDDHFNEPTCIPAIKGGKRDIKVFHRWVSDNESKLKNMTFRDVMSGITKAGVSYHYYCAMD